MTEVFQTFIVAGEASGDRLGADLMSRLRARTDTEVQGVGGTGMIAEGLVSLFPMSDLSVMGVTDVLVHLPWLLWRLKQVERAIWHARPDVVVLIDSQVFSATLAKRLRKAGYPGQIVLYVAPTVWVYGPERAAKLVPLVDEVMCILPFEAAVMDQLGGPDSHYVGHPALAGETIESAGGDVTYVALFPGSRPGELRRHLPFMKAMVARLAVLPGKPVFYLPTLPGLVKRLKRVTRKWAAPVRIVADRKTRRQLFARTRMAVTVSGTATLELAMAGVPMVVVYRGDWAQLRKVRRGTRAGVPKLARLALPNILLGGGTIVPEFFFGEAVSQRALGAAEHLWSDSEGRGAQRAAFRRVREIMEAGEPGAARQDPADRILAHWHGDGGQDPV